MRNDTDSAVTANDERLMLARRWLSARFPGEAFTLAPASADASFRRYFRVSFDASERPSLILMDAPPAREDCRPFIAVARLFARAGVHVPQILAEDLERGLLLLSDLGTTTYLAALDEASAGALYRDALEALVRIQVTSRPGVLPEYDRALLERELRLFPEWYVARQLGHTLDPSQLAALEEVFARILADNLAQPRVYVHRDYHSRNLMVSEPNPGVLDFQDAVHGPITYDLVSLLRDAYVRWDEEHQLDWCVCYWEMARKAALPVAADFAQFYRDFEWIGVQRQIKVVGIFARLAIRDGKTQYLRDQPLVLAYLRDACGRYDALLPMVRLLDALEDVRPAAGYTF